MKICDFCRIQTFKVINCKLTEGKIQKMRTFSVPSSGVGLSALIQSRKSLIAYPLHHSPHREQRYLLPLEGVRGVEPSLGEGRGRLPTGCRFLLLHLHLLVLGLCFPCFLRQARGMPRCSVRSLTSRGYKPCHPDARQGAHR